MPRPVGRPPKPTILHELHGTLNPTRHRNRKTEPVAPGDLSGTEPPACFNERQAEIWRQTVAEAPAGLLRHCDRTLIALWSAYVHDFEEATRLQNQRDSKQIVPFVVAGGKLSPFLAVRKEAARLLAALMPELGFSPSSRPRARREP